MGFDWSTLIGGFIASIIGLLVILILVASIAAGYMKNVNDYEERRRNKSLYDKGCQ